MSSDSRRLTVLNRLSNKLENAAFAMTAIHIRETTSKDADAIHDLYLAVARTPGGIARLASEIDSNYIARIIQNAANSGLMLLAVAETGSDTQVVGSIHAYSPGLYCFSHILSELTIAVHPQRQGSGIGRSLFTGFMARINSGFPHISRVELISRASNGKAIALYKSLGFVQEGELRGRIKNIDGHLESDIPMAWSRPPLAT